MTSSLETSTGAFMDTLQGSNNVATVALSSLPGAFIVRRSLAIPYTQAFRDQISEGRTKTNQALAVPSCHGRRDL